jgi:hypothetical protein
MLLACATLMLGVCLLACVVPTRRALGVEPTIALRMDQPGGMARSPILGRPLRARSAAMIAMSPTMDCDVDNSARVGR